MTNPDTTTCDYVLRLRNSAPEPLDIYELGPFAHRMDALELGMALFGTIIDPVEFGDQLEPLEKGDELLRSPVSRVICLRYDDTGRIDPEWEWSIDSAEPLRVSGKLVR